MFLFPSVYVSPCSLAGGPTVKYHKGQVIKVMRWNFFPLHDNCYRPRSRGDNTFGSVRLSVRPPLCQRCHVWVGRLPKCSIHFFIENLCLSRLWSVVWGRCFNAGACLYSYIAILESPLCCLLPLSSIHSPLCRLLAWFNYTFTFVLTSCLILSVMGLDHFWEGTLYILSLYRYNG